MRPALERLGLLEFFVATVTAEDGMETKSQRFLSAAIKMGRPPNHCVVFDSCLAGVTAAHNCTMKVSVSPAPQDAACQLLRVLSARESQYSQFQ